MIFKMHHVSHRFSDLVFKECGGSVPNSRHQGRLQRPDNYGDEQRQRDGREEGEAKHDIDGQTDENCLSFVVLDEGCNLFHGDAQRKKNRSPSNQQQDQDLDDVLSVEIRPILIEKLLYFCHNLLHRRQPKIFRS